MKQSKLILSSVLVIVFFTAPVFSIQDPLETKLDDRLSKKREMIRNLFNDISTVNLLNGLYLTEPQMREILKLAKKAQRMKREFVEKKGTVYMEVLNDAEQAYQNLFAEIMKGEPAKQGSRIEREAVRIEHQLKEITDKVMRTISDELSVLDQELSKILTPEQQQVINGFNPCLIPPKDLKNPVRAGQASSNDRVINMLRRIREIPSYTWNHRKYQFLSRHVERFSRLRSVMTEEEKEKEIKRLLILTEKVRSLSDTDFELEKETLAEELRPVNMVHELREELEKRVPYMRKPKVSKSARFLLNERIIPILEERISR
jgi:IS1 family transposase